MVNFYIVEYKNDPKSTVELILPPSCVCDNVEGNMTSILEGNIFSKTHSSGWTIKAKIKSDWYSWINKFEADHPVHGKIYGDFGKKVIAKNKEAFDHFVKHHPPEEFDYWDI